jgi:predicted nucleic acid-binding protein
VAKTRAVLDASVIVRAVIDEAHDAREWVEQLRDARAEVIAPDLVYAELANAFARYVRTDAVELERAIHLLASIVELPLDVRANRTVCGLACSLAIQEGLTAYDAHYLALAEAEDAVLVTADRRLAAAASRSILLD